MSKVKQNQLERIYEEINGFDLRIGQFYDPNVHFNGIKFEIRILHKDPDIIFALQEKIKDWISSPIESEENQA